MPDPAPVKTPLKAPFVILAGALVLGAGAYLLLRKGKTSASTTPASTSETNSVSTDPAIPVYMLVGNVGGSAASGGNVAGDSIGSGLNLNGLGGPSLPNQSTGTCYCPEISGVVMDKNGNITSTNTPCTC
jgi:hypothetical protein